MLKDTHSTKIEMKTTGEVENEWKKEGNESTFPASLLYSLLHRWANTGESVKEREEI